MTNTLRNPRFFAAITVLFAAATWFNFSTTADSAAGTSLVLGQPGITSTPQVAGSMVR